MILCLVVDVLKAQEDIAGGQKREGEEEEEGEDTYNEENIEQVGVSAGNQSHRISSLFLKASEILHYSILFPQPKLLMYFYIIVKTHLLNIFKGVSVTSQ